jgi:hypothetical protein
MSLFFIEGKDDEEAEERNGKSEIKAHDIPQHPPLSASHADKTPALLFHFFTKLLPLGLN